MSPCYINLVWSGICLALICHQKNLSIFFFFMCWINSVDSTLFISWWNRRIYLCSISTCLINIVHLIVKQKNLIWFYFHIVESTLLISWWNSLLLLSLSTTCLCLPRGHVTFQSIATYLSQTSFSSLWHLSLTWRGKEYIQVSYLRPYSFVMLTQD